MTEIKGIELTEDTLTNIQIMAPLLNEKEQFAVYGLMCGLILASEKEAV